MKSSDSVRLGGIILALALSLGLSACSAVRLGYNALPDLAYWWLDGYADFGGEQQAPVRSELARLHAWHRREELPRVADVLARMEQLAPREAYDAGRILADRQRRQQDLLATLRHLHRAQLPPAEARQQLLAWLARAQHAPDPAYRTWQEGLVQEGCRIFAAVHASTTAAQREQAARRLRAWRRDLRELSAQPQ